MSSVLKVLTENGITAAQDATIKQIAESNNLEPTDVFKAIQKADKRNPQSTSADGK